MSEITLLCVISHSTRSLSPLLTAMCSRVSSLFQSAGRTLTRSEDLGRTSGPAASTLSSQTPFLTAAALPFLAASNMVDLILWGRSRASRILRAASRSRFSASTSRASSAAAAATGSFRSFVFSSSLALRAAAAALASKVHATIIRK